MAVFPSDTVYGLACDPDNEDAVHRLYRLKGRRPDRAAAVMLFSLELALAALPELGPRTAAALGALLPGPVTLLLPNPAHRFPLACGDDPETLGLRVPRLGEAAEALGGASWPVLQSSANPTGDADARARGRGGGGAGRRRLLLDGGELPGVASTVVDLRPFESEGRWEIRRAGALSGAGLEDALRNI